MADDGRWPDKPRSRVAARRPIAMRSHAAASPERAEWLWDTRRATLPRPEITKGRRKWSPCRPNGRRRRDSGRARARTRPETLAIGFLETLSLDAWPRASAHETTCPRRLGGASCTTPRQDR